MRKAKVTEQQIEKLRHEISKLVTDNVWGGWKEYLNIWERNEGGETPYDKFVYLGMSGYNGFVFWRQADFHSIYHDCGFCETMTFREFLTQITGIWIAVATRMILADLADNSDELAY